MKLPFKVEMPAGLPRRSVVFAIVALLVLGGAAWFVNDYLTAARQARQEAERASLQDSADSLAQALGEPLSRYRAALRELAGRPGVIAALTGGDATVRSDLGAELENGVPNALKLRLIPIGRYEPHIDETPPLTYASVDLLRTATETGAAPRMEVHLAGSAGEHLVVIQPAPPDGAPVGFLHLSVALDPVRAEVRKLLPQDVHVEVRQPVARGRPIIIAKQGELAATAQPPAVAGIDGSSWVVSIRAGSIAADAADGPDFGWLGLLAAVAAVLALAAVLLLRRLSGPAPGSSETVYQGAIKAILDGSYPDLEALLPGGTGSGAGTPLSAGLDGDDITRIKASAGGASELDFNIDAPEPSGIIVEETTEEDLAITVPAKIFRTYDIRGIVDETLTTEGVHLIGRALGSEALARSQNTVVVARDGRNSSEALRDALVQGLRESGCDVIDIGLTPTPVLYFATHYLETRSGVMITGSHNPANYNGLKIVLGGETLSGDAIQAIRQRIESRDFSEGAGDLEATEIVPDYIRRISEEIPVNLSTALKVVVDCGNSVPGIVAPHILRAIGHDVVELYCDVDGDFPNHHPDPSQEENLADLIETVANEAADIGIALDGDGDRLGVVDREGNIIWPDRQMMLFSRDVLSRNPGAKIIFDVKCSKRLKDVIEEAGGVPIMCQTGHSIIKHEMVEHGALLAGEMSGHIFFKERWYGFDDALYSAARLLEILVNAEMPPEQVFANLPGGVATPELRLDMSEERHQAFMAEVLEQASFDDGEVTTIDGLRVDFADSFGLVRASNTTPCLVLRFEGDDEAALERVKERFRTFLLGLDPALELPF